MDRCTWWRGQRKPHGWLVKAKFLSHTCLFMTTPGCKKKQSVKTVFTFRWIGSLFCVFSSFPLLLLVSTCLLLFVTTCIQVQKKKLKGKKKLVGRTTKLTVYAMTSFGMPEYYRIPFSDIPGSNSMFNSLPISVVRCSSKRSFLQAVDKFFLPDKFSYGLSLVSTFLSHLLPLRKAFILVLDYLAILIK